MNYIRKLQSSLNKASNRETKKWFENYLKKVISYRGVKTPAVFKIVKDWRKKESLDKLSLKQQFKIACDLIQEKKAEDKFAGILYIQKYLLREFTKKPNFLLASFAGLFQKNAFWDWSTTDWFCVRVLDPLILNSDKSVAEEIASWSKSKNLWQRRASLVSFRNSAKNKIHLVLIKRNISILVEEKERFIQTAIGWVISELSRKYPNEAKNIVSKHFDKLPLEVIQRHTKYLPNHKKLIKLKRLH